MHQDIVPPSRDSINRVTSVTPASAADHVDAAPETGSALAYTDSEPIEAPEADEAVDEGSDESNPAAESSEGTNIIVDTSLSAPP